MGKLNHKTVYANPARIAVTLPYTPELQKLHPNGGFPLVEDPLATKRAVLIGMFVVRPVDEGWKQPVVHPDGMPAVHTHQGWAFNFKPIPGGGPIAAGNVFDAYRLALQYGTADAVMVGSNTVAAEGVSRPSHDGYLWQPYGPATWPHLHEADPHLLEKIMAQRKLWHDAGYVSSRMYPAQIIVSQSGAESKPDDFLAARVFTERHPNGDPIEVYVLTSEDGAKRIRERAQKYDLANRIDDIVIAVSPAGKPSVLDWSQVPKILYDAPFNMRVINHDGGQKVLSEVAKAGVLTQLNLTMTRGRSLKQVIPHVPGITDDTARHLLADLEDKVDYFFKHEHTHRVHPALLPAYIAVDEPDEAVVVTFDARGMQGYDL